MRTSFYKYITILLTVLLFVNSSIAQCSLCTKTAEQLGEGPASSLNSGIVYLMLSPFVIMGFIGYRWWKKEKEVLAEEAKSLQH